MEVFIKCLNTDKHKMYTSAQFQIEMMLIV